MTTVDQPFLIQLAPPQEAYEKLPLIEPISCTYVHFHFRWWYVIYFFVLFHYFSSDESNYGPLAKMCAKTGVNRRNSIAADQSVLILLQQADGGAL